MDFELVIPFTDRVRIGGDVLILAGYATFTSCVWSCTTFFGIDVGAGLDVTIFGGVAIFTFCHIQINNLLACTATVGQVTCIVGGVTVFTGCSVAFFSGAEMFDGAGALTVVAGVMIQTGVAIEDNYGMVAGFGVGFDIALLSGLMVSTGRAGTQFFGPMYAGLLGGFTYVGAGTYVVIGSTAESYGPLGTEAGAGGVIYVGGGLAIYIAHPIVIYNGVWNSMMMGGLVSLPAGLLVWIACPIVLSSAVESYLGIGGAVFVGAGVAVMGYSPTFIHSAVINRVRDFWIMGSCEPEENSYVKGPVQLYGKGFSPACEDRREHDADNPDEPWRALEGAATAVTVPGGIPRLKTSFLAYHMPILSPTSFRRPAAVAGAATAAPSSSLFISRPALEPLRAYLPPKLFEKVERFDTQLQDLEDALDFLPASDRKLPAFHINSPMEGFCGACDVENLEGPGLASCQNTASCDPDAFTPPPGQAGLMSGVDFENFDYPEHFLIVANMDVALPVGPVAMDEGEGGEGRRGRASGASPTPTFPRGVNATTLELALLAALGQNTGDPLDDAVGPEALYLTVFSAKADEFFAGLVPRLAESARAAHYASWTRKEMEEGKGEGRRRRTREEAMAADDTSMRRFKAVFVSPSRNKADAILASLQGAPLSAEREYSGATGADWRRQQQQQQEPPGIDIAASVGAYLKSALAAEGQDEQELEHDVTMWYEQLLYVPGYHSEAFLNHAPVTGVGAYSILLSDPSRPSAPLHHLQYKTVAYDVLLEQFPPKSLVNIYAVGVAVADEDGARPPYLLATVTTDSQGNARVQRRFRALALPPGDYFFRALDMATGAEGLSPVYSLSDAPQTRRLYGPVMWV